MPRSVRIPAVTDSAISIDPKVDYAFKCVFGNDKDTRVLAHLLHAILTPRPEARIVELQILNPFTEKMALDEKLSILDIKALDQLGRRFNIEMQMLPVIALRERILYYWARLYTEQLRKGEPYTTLRPTISVCFVDGVVFPDVSAYHTAFELSDPKNGVVLTDHLKIHFFQLPRFTLRAEELRTPLEAWLYFLRKATELDPGALPAALDVPEIRVALERLKMLAQTDIQREIYEGRLKARRDEEARLYEATQQGLQQGLQKGLQEGRQKGVLIGRIELLRRFLKQAPLERAQLEAMDLQALQAMEADLNRQLGAL
jgi:predicted transposase/invertase (TIGR01784 family)